MPTRTSSETCIVCSGKPLEIDVHEGGGHGTCTTCGTYYSNSRFGNGVSQWHSPLRAADVQLLREYWHEHHRKLPPLGTNIRDSANLIQHKAFNDWLLKRSAEVARLGEESINEHRETLRRLA